MLDGLGEGQGHIDVHGCYGPAVCVDIVVVLVDMFPANDPSDHRFALLIAYDLGVMVWNFGSILVLAVGSGQIVMRGIGSSSGSNKGVVPRCHDRVVAGLDV